MSELEQWTLDGLALNDGTVLTLESLEAPPPSELEEWIKGADSHGALLAREPLCDNRTITMGLRVERQATMDLALAKIGLVVDKLKEAQRNANGLALVWVPADATLSGTFRCLSGQISELPINIQSGWLVKTPLVTLRLVCLPFLEGAEVISYVNEITNPGFEVNTTGWGTASSFRNNSGATLTRVTTEHHTGVAALRVVTTATANQGADFTALSVVAGRPKTVAGWVKGNVGGESVQLMVGDGTVGNASSTIVCTTSWQRVSVTLTPVATGTTGAAFIQTAASVKTFFVDDVLAVDGTVAPTYFDGSSGTGYVWLGTTDLSKSAGPNAALSTEPVATLELTGVAGDVPALGKLTVTDNATQARRYVAWGLESRYYPTSSPPSLLIDSSSMVTSGFAGALSTQSGAYSGASNNTISAAIGTQIQAICGLGNLAHIGRFRVMARVFCGAWTNAGPYVRLSYQTLDGPLRSLPFAQITRPGGGSASGWNHLELGQINIPVAILGSQRWTGRIEAVSDEEGPTSVKVDVLELIPAEQYGRARATWAYAPGVTLGADAFTSIAATTAMDGRVAPTGGTWDTSGSTGDFVAADGPVTGNETETRANTGDTGSGRHAVLGSTDYTNIEVGIDAWRTASAGIGTTFQAGVQARWVDASNRFIVVLTGDNRFAALKYIGGSPTYVGSPVTLSALQLSAWYRIRVVIYSSGRFIASLMDTNNSPTAEFAGYDSALATGGTLATGKPGFIDLNATATASTRYYDNFYAATPATEPLVMNPSQSLEVRYDTTLREDTAGVYYGPPPEYVGARFFVPNAGGPARKARVAVLARRNDVLTAEDDTIADSLLIQASYTPRWVAVPR